MQLYFMKQWANGSPTYFKEKIEGVIGFPQKIHTIRVDKNKRWKAGNKIHFSQWADKPYRSACEPIHGVLLCTSVQSFEVLEDNTVYVAKKLLTEKQVFKLAVNDGFSDSLTNNMDGVLERFFGYFNAGFKGRIIHWTNKKY